jgi:hypothetical protein
LDTSPDARRVPPVPLTLGLGGLIPFWALAIAYVVPNPIDPGVVSLALATYAATILAFLGGIRWGLAIPAEPRRAFDFVIGVLPQLLGWGSLALSDRWRFAALALLILIIGQFDRRLVARGLAPPWFGRLRTILSLGAGAALFLAALA